MTSRTASYSELYKLIRTVIWILVLVGGFVGATMTQASWMPHAKKFIAFVQNKNETEQQIDDHDDPVGAAPDTLELSDAAWKNIGLKTGTVEAEDFVKVISVPAVVVERPGRSQIEITAPMTGLVTQVFPVEREIVKPGTPLFELRLTHEDVVSAQSDFLAGLQKLDVLTKELKRLQGIGEGVIPGKRIVEKNYEKETAKASLAAVRQSLLLHGLTEKQVNTIEKDRRVLQEVLVVAPPFATNHDHTSVEHQYHVQTVNVNRGQSVNAGQLMGGLADHCLLYVEGHAFEDDLLRLVDSARDNSTIQVVPNVSSSQASNALDLKIQSIADEIDRDSRALKFYLLLPNEKRRLQASGQERFVSWKYRPGQRMEARIPTSKVMKNKIVLPAEAVVIDGPNAFVFEQNGSNFDRVDVQVLYRDKDTVVLANDGVLLGSVIAMTGAYDMHLALKNQGGGAMDSHGHSH
jgi:multidrug efflux pump subunit AcrA (membrane-fusion protein)